MKTANVYGFNYFVEYRDAEGGLDYRSEQTKRNIVAISEQQAHQALVADINSEYPLAGVSLVGSPVLVLQGVQVAEDEAPAPVVKLEPPSEDKGADLRAETAAALAEPPSNVPAALSAPVEETNGSGL